jgi:hypothetical protein
MNKISTTCRKALSCWKLLLVSEHLLSFFQKMLESQKKCVFMTHIHTHTLQLFVAEQVSYVYSIRLTPIYMRQHTSHEAYSSY